MITVVTSFTEENYREYAQDFISSFKQCWPKDVKLVVYYEGTNLRDDWKPISQVEGLANWMDAIGHFDLMSGSIAGEYNINFDARMVRKAFIEAHACRQFKGKVIWVDADVITFAPVTSQFMSTVLPDDSLVCYLGRDNNKILDYTESGFIGFNTEHPYFEKFMNLYISIFTSGTIFAQKGWHDCYGFDAARKMFWMAKPQSKAAFNDLSDGLPPNTHHPFINSVLGSCMNHRKGKRKDGRFCPGDLVVKRTEPYWNQETPAPQKQTKVIDKAFQEALASGYVI
jgi:hypothetical protein